MSPSNSSPGCGAKRKLSGVCAAVLLLASAAAGCSSSGASGNGELRRTIATGLTEQFNVLRIPDGSVEIMSPFSFGEADPTARRFPPTYLVSLRGYERAGLLALREQAQTQSQVMGSMGAKMFLVEPVAAVRAAADSAHRENGYIRVLVAEPEVERIVLDTVYHTSQLSASEQYRLVLGTYIARPTPIVRQFHLSVEDSVYRFKALLKLDPFTKRLRFVTADYGRIGRDDWQTHNVP